MAKKNCSAHSEEFLKTLLQMPSVFLIVKDVVLHFKQNLYDFYHFGNEAAKIVASRHLSVHSNTKFFLFGKDLYVVHTCCTNSSYSTFIVSSNVPCL